MVDQYQDDSDFDDDTTVLNVEGSGIEPYYMEGFINGNRFKTMIDSGWPVTIFEIEELKGIMKRQDLQVQYLIEKYVDFNGKPLDLLGYVFCELKVDKKYVRKARILVAGRGSKSIISREWLKTLNYKFEQSEKGELDVNMVEMNNEELSVESKEFVREFPELFSRQGKVENHEVKIKLKNEAKISQQKGRRIPIQLQKSEDSKRNRFLKEGHIEKVNEMKDNVFIQPTKITVKKDRSVKIALDARALNEAIDKDKYQMPNLENLLDMIAGRLDSETGVAWYSSLDMTCAYGQIPLHVQTAKHCNFQKIGGESTGTYQFTTGFYGLTVMPTEFQKVMDIL